MLSRFHLIPERHGQTDRQTDGQTDRIAISISCVSVLTRRAIKNAYLDEWHSLHSRKRKLTSGKWKALLTNLWSYQCHWLHLQWPMLQCRHCVWHSWLSLLSAAVWDDNRWQLDTDTPLPETIARLPHYQIRAPVSKMPQYRNLKVWYGIVEFNVPLDTLWVISEMVNLKVKVKESVFI